MITLTARSSTAITLAVWKALFLREAVSRVTHTRGAWVWVLFEPAFHVVYLMVLFTAIRMRVVGGIDTPVWILVGILAYFMFIRVWQQSMHAVDANQALFAYRQVKPVDTVLVRAGLEGYLMILIAIILLSGSWLYGFAVIPVDPLAVLEAFLGMWLLGLGFGLATSVAVVLVPEMGKIISMATAPLYILSGVIFPIANIPQPFRDYLLFNPLVHGVEATRLAFAPHYQAVSGLSIAYIYGFAVVSLFLGLALHLRFQEKMVAK